MINVSSDAAAEAYETWGGYGASKAALDQLSAVLAEEEPGLRVWAVDPGDMRTDLYAAAVPGRRRLRRPLPETGGAGLSAAAGAAGGLRTVPGGGPAGRAGDPGCVAATGRVR